MIINRLLNLGSDWLAALSEANHLGWFLLIVFKDATNITLGPSLRYLVAQESNRNCSGHSCSTEDE